MFVDRFARSGLGCTLANNTAASTFDASGNTLQFNLDGNANWDQATADQYDFENRLIAATRASGNITIVYDGDGNRINKTVNGTTTKYLVDDRNPTGYAQVLEEQHSDGNPIVSYVWGLGPAPVCQARITSIDPLEFTTSYFGCDGQGTVRFLTFGQDSHAGWISDTYTFDAFGILTASTGSTPNNYLYTGQQWDSDLGMYCLRARYYNPNEGRFWTMDTYEGALHEPRSLHKYAYCQQDALDYSDPSGLVIAPEFGLQGNYNVAITYLNNGSPTAKAFIKKLDDDPLIIYYVRETKYGDQFDWALTQRVLWNPYSALALEPDFTTAQSPALGLLHELRHAYHYFNFIPESPDDSEVISFESICATELGEPVRSKHDGKAFNVADPTKRAPIVLPKDQKKIDIIPWPKAPGGTLDFPTNL